MSRSPGASPGLADRRSGRRDDPADADDPGADMDIEQAVQDADLRVLLMALFQVTGDWTWLEPPFRPRRDVRIIPPEDAGLPDDVARRIRAGAVEVAARLADGAEPAITDPGDELMVELMSVCLGQDVPAEYAPMMREEMGFVSRDVVWPTPPDLVPSRNDSDDGVHAERSGFSPSVMVIGAGASGVAMGVRLQRLGLDYTIVERGASVGGVWRDNRYPGAGVDTPNHAYSFSFAPPHRWSRYFAPQSELESYITGTADDFGVTQHVEFHTEVVGASWDEAADQWVVSLRRVDPSGGHDGNMETRRVEVLISAIGQLNVAKAPVIEGLDSFEGPVFHSSEWPDDLDVTGRRIAIIGTGASAMQIVPAIADRVDRLTVFQRSAQWARPIPRYQDPIPVGSQWLFEHFPFYAAWFRFTMLWRYGDGLLPLLRKDPDWPHPERSVNRVNDRHRQEMADHIESELADRPDLIEKCMPTYPPYGKRILLDAGWFAAMRAPGVELVVDAVDRVDATGVVDDVGRHHDADVIVLATGFEVFQMAARIGIRGRDGVDLADVWADDDPTAYLGITVPGFPNFFCLQGPTTGLGHGGSAIFQAECHARHITACLAEVARAGGRAIEVRQEPVDEYTARLDAEHDDLIWTHPGMRNWYRNDAGRVVAIMPWRLVDYWAMTHDPDLSHYVIT